METMEQLPDFVLADLYKNSLVFIDEEIKAEAISKEPAKPVKRYLGDYQKKIIVLVNEADSVYASETNLNFLSGILNACKLNLAHIALINFNNDAVNFLQLKKELKPQFLLSFGVDALQIELPFTMPLYQVQQYDNCYILTAPSLTALNNESAHAVEEKKKLWKSLQKMFSLEKR